MANIATVEEFKAYARDKTPTENYDYIELALEAAEDSINTACGRKFVVASGSSTRVYTPTPGSSILRIHDCTAVSAVVEDGSSVASTAYQLEPLNGLTWAGLAVPYEQIRLLDGFTWYTDFDRATVSVTATWGWAAIPDRIKQACFLVANDILSNRDLRFGVVVTDIGATSVRTNPVVRATVDKYRRAEGFGVA